MRLFKKGKKIDVEQRIRDVGNAYRIQHPERVLGFAGCFLKPEPEIYISDQIEEYLTEDPSFTMDLLEVYRQYDSDDFGKLPKLEAELQLGDAFMFGDWSWVKGIYDTRIGTVICEHLYTDVLLYLETEQEQAEQFREEQISIVKSKKQ